MWTFFISFKFTEWVITQHPAKNGKGEYKFAFVPSGAPFTKIGIGSYREKDDVEYRPLQKVAWSLCKDFDLED